MGTSDTLQYKDVEIPATLAGLINHMADVEGYREELHNLGNQWDLLTILGQMSGTGTDMTGTRQGFLRLTSELLSQLGLETLKKTTQELAGKAQVAVDIVIRNLFERTADIGFLATDDDIREFLRTAADLNGQLAEAAPGSEAERELADLLAGHVDRLVARFREYVAKYTVYFNIILMDTEGNVLAQLDRDNDIRHSADPLVAESLTTAAEYVEVFRESDLLAGRGDSLLYAYRVAETNEADSAPLGVLCLCFRFQNEMEGVFRNLGSEGDWSVMTLLDRTGRVIASSDAYHVPLGAVLDFDVEAKFTITRFAGRQYLAKTCATKGYQGFFGLGWYGHVMIPLEHAFNQSGSAGLRQQVDQAILEAVMNDPRLFSEKLRSIPVQAENIQRELERTVWNGNVRESDAQSKVLLWNISDAGARTKMVFEQSIGNLHETVVSGILNDVEFQAALAVDIMDRNLYERANDCRWWALTSAFRKILSQPSISTLDAETIGAILGYINGLYTVYANLFVYDERGRILAVSDPGESRIVGNALSDDLSRVTLSLKGSQDYAVSPFEATSLYGGRHTYIYGAAITDIARPERVVGGIGIVFDSEPQFREMLMDSLPRSERGDVLEGCFGVFADRKGKVISCTSPRFEVGGTLGVDTGFSCLARGEGGSRIIEFDGSYYAVGARCSAGYREYKVDDGYKNDVIAMVFEPLAEVSERSRTVVRRREIGMGVSHKRATGADCIELATFYIGDKWLGINAIHVDEAVTPSGLTTMPGTPDYVIGKFVHNDELITVIDIRTQLRLPSVRFDPKAPIVVVRADNANIGIVVDALGEIPEICMDRVDRASSVLDSQKGYVDCIIKPELHSEQKDLLVVIDPTRLVKALICGLKDDEADAGRPKPPAGSPRR
ncbi:CheW protein [Pseudodesulfovibrio mercurii]|uniref:CheW protein n=1 Tax=Pseudodesulfovibrio mercurii TaxID=641491 RepID=F0JIU3_9BACT|nr:chemotaxis protein CheW [Pseudodesulfovibrio mercurii]EGB15842.1 CheW protein [Pseudodesulfovibrio mercurii]